MLEKKRILIIEDEKDMVNVLKIRLSSMGYDVIAGYDGQEGLSLAQKHNPDLIILDLMLPKMDGYKVCRILKFDDKYKNIPVIIYTARTHDSDRRLAEECGANAFIPKTLGQSVLIDRIKKLLPPA